MAEYIKLDDLMKFPIRIDHYDKEHGNEVFVLGIESVLEYAENLPAADVVEVVRCKDCNKSKESHVVEGWGWCMTDQHSHRADHFCGYGERRGESE